MQKTLSLLTVVACGCMGKIGVGDEPGVFADPAAAPAGSMGAAPPGMEAAPPAKAASACATLARPRPVARIRRLTRAEYANTVRELLGEAVAPELLPANPANHRFDTNPDLGVVSGPDAESYQLASRAVSAGAVARKHPLFSCAGAESQCLSALLDGWALRAFRRPLTRDERARYEAFFAASRPLRGYSETTRLFVQAVLQSPSFLYRTELGPRPTGRGARSVTLDPYEAASALSYLFSGTLPDAELLAAAAAGRLASAPQLEAQARRLLAGPRGLHVVRGFFEQWLGLDRVETLARDPKVYPEWSPALARTMRTEAMDFVEKVVWAGDARVATLLGSPTTFANGVRRDLDPAERAGILTLPAVLTLSGGNAGSSPLYRGKLVAEKLFCVELPPPPEGADQAKFTLKDPTPRQEAEARLGDPLCGGCHRLMDRAGFGFENYDGIGRFRTAERGQPIDGRGELLVSGDVDGPFERPRDLVPRLLASSRFADCFVSQVAEYTLGVDRKSGEVCLTPTARDRWQRTGGDLRELLVAMAGAPELQERLSQEEP